MNDNSWYDVDLFVGCFIRGIEMTENSRWIAYGVFDFLIFFYQLLRSISGIRSEHITPEKFLKRFQLCCKSILSYIFYAISRIKHKQTITWTYFVFSFEYVQIHGIIVCEECESEKQKIE